MSNNNDEREWMTYSTYDIIGFRRTNKPEQEVGVEIEVEGSRLPPSVGTGAGWTVTRDGSLRGESFEYIFNGPKPRKAVDKLIDGLWNTFRDSGSTLNDSYRTSVHVHLNFGHKTLLDVFNMFCAYSVVEDILMEFCGTQRKGNLFCLRTKDAQYLMSQVTRSIRDNRLRDINDNVRYSAINLNALAKYGSIEFRAMRGLTTPEPVKQWVKMLLELYDYACGPITPREMVEQQSMYGIRYLDQIFSDESVRLLTANMSTDSLVEALYEGSRRIQDIAYNYDDKFTAARAWIQANPTPVAKPSKSKVTIEPGWVQFDRPTTGRITPQAMYYANQAGSAPAQATSLPMFYGTEEEYTAQRHQLSVQYINATSTAIADDFMRRLNSLDQSWINARNAARIPDVEEPEGDELDDLEDMPEPEYDEGENTNDDL